MFHGLTLNLKTGSISGLTSAPGSHSPKQSSSDKLHGVTSKKRKRSRDGSSHSSRSITIDLTKVLAQ